MDGLIAATTCAYDFALGTRNITAFQASVSN